MRTTHVLLVERKDVCPPCSYSPASPSQAHSSSTPSASSKNGPGSLRGPHVVLFWIGLGCDTTGTTLMSIMARTSAEAAPAIHGITGLAAILLMLFHAGWATLVYFQGKRGGAAALKRERTFHRLSAAVWVAWLVPYVIGMLVGIPMIKLGTVPAVIASLVVAAIAAVLVFRPAKRS